MSLFLPVGWGSPTARAFFFFFSPPPRPDVSRMRGARPSDFPALFSPLQVCLAKTVDFP